MDVKEESLKLHKDYKGILEIKGDIDIKNKHDLSIAYTPGVAEPCREIAKNKDKAYKYTIKGKTIAIVTDGTAVLGLGDIGAEAGLPVIEGKALLLKEFGGVNAFPICLGDNDPDEIINTIVNISGGFAGIHLEDIKAPKCFYIEDELKKKLDIPVYHDDQHGTAIAILAGLYNAFKIVKKDIKDIKILVNGAGASGIAITKLLMLAGAKNIVLSDINGAIVEGDSSLNIAQKEISKVTNRNFEKGSLEDVIKGKDVFIGVSVANVLTKEMVGSMNKNAIVFALANPIPEIMPKEAKLGGARIIATGRGDFPNQINNLLVFPGIFKGALNVHATEINDEMKLEVAKNLAKLVSPKELNEKFIIPDVFDERVVNTVATSVENVAKKMNLIKNIAI